MLSATQPNLVLPYFIYVSLALHRCVKKRPGDAGELRHKCLATLEVLSLRGGRRSEPHDGGGGALQRRTQLERLAESWGVEVPWHMGQSFVPIAD